MQLCETFAQITAPAEEPVTLEEALIQVRGDGTDALPAPEGPSVALAGAGAGQLSTGSYRYKATYKLFGAETEAGPASAAVSVTAPGSNGKITVTFPACPAGITRVLYRTAANGAEYFRIGELSADVYTDNVPDTSLGVGAPTKNATRGAEAARLIAPARAAAEQRTRRAWARRTFELHVAGFPQCLREQPLPLGNVVSLDYVKYYNSNNILSILSVDKFDKMFFGGRQPSVALNATEIAPPTYCRPDAVIYGFTAGTTPAETPPDVKQAILLIISELFNNREGFLNNYGGGAQPLPHAAAALLSPHVMLFKN